jgi:alkanesulfonate monooxygenase SsuD/methylene tetrahydromethanopterin reductase-like flavin-dependent oxidoreductase (luciferase family)
VVGSTEAEAAAKLEDYVQSSNPESAIVTLQQWAGIDVRHRDPDEELDLADLKVKGINSEHAADYLRRSARAGERFTVGDLIRMYAFTGGAGNVVAGTPEQIADTMERWVREADVDGFNIAYMLRRHSIADFADHVVPELRRRGLLPEPDAATATSLRQQITGDGPYLPVHHPGHRARTTA